MSDNLYFSRDTKVLAFSDDTYWELPVLDGFSFSQATNATEVTLSEMDNATTGSRRGRRIFNDSYAPAEWSFSTYVRPYKSVGGIAPGGVRAATGEYSSDNTAAAHHAVEEPMWASLVAGSAVTYSNTTGDYSGNLVSDTNKLAIDFGSSNASALKTFDLFFILGAGSDDGSRVVTTATGAGSGANDADVVPVTQLAGIAIGDVAAWTISSVTRTAVVTAVSAASGAGNVTLGDAATGIVNTTSITFSRQIAYKIENCVVNEAALDFEIDGIATIAWSGMGKIIKESTPPLITALTGDEEYISEGTLATTNFIRNRLTTLDITSTSPTTETYIATLTGGNITISNNISFLTPETLGSVNQPLAHVTGSRTVGGNFTCYLNTGNDGSADLFQDLLDATTTVTNNFNLVFTVGGSTAPNLKLTMPTCHLELPAHSIDDVISVDTTFSALPSTISGTNEVTIEYVGA